MLHDSWMMAAGIQNIICYLKSNNTPFYFCQIKDSVTAFFLGKYATQDQLPQFVRLASFNQEDYFRESNDLLWKYRRNEVINSLSTNEITNLLWEDRKSDITHLLWEDRKSDITHLLWEDRKSDITHLLWEDKKSDITHLLWEDKKSDITHLLWEDKKSDITHLLWEDKKNDITHLLWEDKKSEVINSWSTKALLKALVKKIITKLRM